ncbi:hypothetical protein [Bradyrhizobium sp. CCGUVB14]|nr:hypothetical protein [Bradyrhizobium sp. CCGUVB14]
MDATDQDDIALGLHDEFHYSSRITDNILRVGVNYKLGGPVVAKY